MRLVTLPPPEQKNQILWDQVESIRYTAEGPKRWLTLTLKRGGEKHLEPHQARDLYYSVAQSKQCEFPCWMAHDLDEPPKTCLECQMAANLDGIGVNVRPPRIPDRQRQPWRITGNFMLICVVGLLLYLLLFMASTRRLGILEDNPPPSRVDAPKYAPTSVRGAPGENRGASKEKDH